MLSLVKKDFYTIRQTLQKQIFLGLVLGVITSFYINSGIYIVGMLLMLVSVSLVSSFTVDEYSKFNAYALSLPISRKDLVSSKYYLYFIVNIATGFVALVLGAIIDAVNSQLDFLPLLMGVLACMCIFIIITSLSIPLYFKFGIEKGRILYSLLYLLPFFFVVFFGNNLSALTSLSELEQEKIVIFGAIGLVLLMVIILVVSYKISLKIVNKKEY